MLYIIAHILGIVVWEDDHGDSSDISDSSNSSRNKGRGTETHWTLSTVLCVSGATSLAPCRIFMVERIQLSQIIDKDYQRGEVELVACYKVSFLGLQYILSDLLQTQWNCIWLTLVTIQKPAIQPCS